jgi:hypothetical protein
MGVDVERDGHGGVAEALADDLHGTPALSAAVA